MWLSQGDEYQNKVLLRDLLSKKGVSEERCTNGSGISHGESWYGEGVNHELVDVDIGRKDLKEKGNGFITFH